MVTMVVQSNLMRVNRGYYWEREGFGLDFLGMA